MRKIPLAVATVAMGIALTACGGSGQQAATSGSASASASGSASAQAALTSVMEYAPQSYAPA